MVTAPEPLDVRRIRNFSIIAHVDHGKSTLSDRILEITGAVDPRLMRAQYLDSMDIERERGITIKAQNVRVHFEEHVLQLIDTPGHVDFGYEVSRSLAACEGAVLLVDASQGIQAQTLANCYQALENDLEIVPVLNKIDLPAADPERCMEELDRVLGLPPESVLAISAKTGEGVRELLRAIIERIPAPSGDPELPLRALVFDSHYDQYRGVISSIRIVEGVMRDHVKIKMMQAGASHDIEEIGIRTPEMLRVSQLGPGEVGYLVAGIKDVGGARSGETITESARPATRALEGYQDPKPMIFCGIYPIDGDDLPDLRDALDKLMLNDASITYEPESSHALGFGFRCGFLGLLHMEIVRERLEREFNLDIIATAPSVVYRAFLSDGTEMRVDNPVELPDPSRLDHIDEPMLSISILTPSEFLGTVMDLCQSRRAEMVKMDYLSTERVELRYRIPLAEVVIDFFDALKSRTKGYASLDYEPAEYVTSNLVRVDLLINHEPVDAFSTIVHRSNADLYGRKMAERLKELIPRQMFDVPIQAAIGGRVIARETVKARRKDVLAKCYGGDITRKRKLLEKQKEGKKRMKNLGRVEVPQEAFVAALRLEED
ncbi:MAG: elongation factor 4 [Acidimicrobiaceae bacterium]|nr:elongation factor 4 [Acidimicrobiaceae bacterium]